MGAVIEPAVVEALVLRVVVVVVVASAAAVVAAVAQAAEARLAATITMQMAQPNELAIMERRWLFLLAFWSIPPASRLVGADGLAARVRRKFISTVDR